VNRRHRLLLRWALSAVIFLVLWQLVVVLLHVRPIIVPPPLAVARELASEWAWYLNHSWYTLLTTLAGFVLAVVVGVLVAIMLVGSPWFEESIYPMIVAFNSVPKVAIAPLFVIWLGTGAEPKISIAFLIAVFPVIVDAAHGLRSVSKDILDLGKVLKGSAWDFFFKVRLPGALPSILAGMKVAISLSLVGTIVGEFVASQRGLGYVILSAQGTFDTVRVFAAIALLSVMGVLLYAAVGWLEWRVSRWKHLD
jgi:NitT/TauT family transport system permease protein